MASNRSCKLPGVLDSLDFLSHYILQQAGVTPAAGVVIVCYEASLHCYSITAAAAAAAGRDTT